MKISHHAAERYNERFGQNLTPQAAKLRLEDISKRAKFVRMLAGHAKEYGVQGMRFVVADQTVLTVYRPDSKHFEPEAA